MTNFHPAIGAVNGFFFTSSERVASTSATLAMIRPNSVGLCCVSGVGFSQKLVPINLGRNDALGGNVRAMLARHHHTCGVSKLLTPVPLGAFNDRNFRCSLF